MSNSIMRVAAVSLLVLAAACARNEPEPVVIEPVSDEPVFTGKL